MSSLQDRISKLFSEYPDKKATHLARYLGISRSAVSDWMSGNTKSIQADNAFKVGKFFGVNPEWVATGKGRKKIESESQTDIDALWLSHYEKAEVEMPHLAEIEISAGIYEVIEDYGQRMPMPKSLLRSKGVPDELAAFTTVKGNSMAPVLPHGATVAVDRSQTDIEDGKMYVIDHFGSLRIKYLYKMPGGGIRIRSDNSVEWPCQQYIGEQAKTIKVIGRVFWYSVLI